MSPFLLPEADDPLTPRPARAAQEGGEERPREAGEVGGNAFGTLAAYRRPDQEEIAAEPDPTGPRAAEPALPDGSPMAAGATPAAPPVAGRTANPPPAPSGAMSAAMPGHADEAGPAAHARPGMETIQPGTTQATMAVAESPMAEPSLALPQAAGPALAEPDAPVAPTATPTGAPNQAPIVLAPIGDRAAQEHAPFLFTLPPDAFADADAGDRLTYSASLADGAPLPGWLQFDPATLRFSGTPGPGDIGSLALRVTATDRAGASATQVFRLEVEDTPEAPTAIALTGTSVAENSAAGTVVATLSATDPDAGATHSFSLLGGSDLFEIVGNQLLVKAGAVLDHETAPGHTLTIRATDETGLSVDRVVTIGVTDANEAPTALFATATRDFIVNGSFEQTSAQIGHGSWAGFRQIAGWELAAGPQIELVASGHRGIQAADGRLWMDMDASPGNIAIRQQVIGLEEGASYTLSFAISGTHGWQGNGVELWWNGARVDGWQASGTGWAQHSVTLVSAPGGAPDVLEFRGTGPADNVGVALDAVRLVGASSTLAVAENAAAGTVVAQLAATDPDAGASHVFSIVGGSDHFAVVGGQLVVKAGAALDFETAASHQVTLRATDQGGLSVDRVVTIGVTDVNEAPTAILLHAQRDFIVNGGFEDLGSIRVADGGWAPARRLSGWELVSGPQMEPHATGHRGISAVDGRIWMDLGASPGNVAIRQAVQGLEDGQAYTLSFAASGTSGWKGNGVEVWWNGTRLDAFETPTTAWQQRSYTLTSAAGDGPDILEFRGTGPADNVGTAIDAVRLVGAVATPQVAENAAAGTVVANLAALDPDAGATHSFSLLGGSNLFELVGSQLRVKAGAVLDFEAARSHAITLRATDQHGAQHDQQVTIAVLDVPEAGNDQLNVSAATAPAHWSGGLGTDTLHILDGAGGWTVQLTSGQVTGQQAGLMTFSDGADGLITFASGATLQFEDVERLSWALAA
jgi:hypothetical protein